MQVYQIKITLEGSNPAIWRRVLVSPEETMYDFHYVIQAVMGWEDAQPHQFIKDGKFYLEKMEGDEEFSDAASVDYSDLCLGDILIKENDAMQYEYDFNDNWMHSVVLEKILPADEKAEYPVCTGGERDCPVEECGGLEGYYELLEIMKEPSHPEYDEIMECMGDDYDPAYFSVDETNEVLREVF